jgi:hypothetical protein
MKEGRIATSGLIRSRIAGGRRAQRQVSSPWTFTGAIRFLVEDVNSLLCWRVVVPVPDLSFDGRRGIGVEREREEAPDADDDAVAEDAWADARQRLALARSFQARLDAGEARTQADLARQVGGISASRVGQFLRLLRLAPSILEHIKQDRAAHQALSDRTLRRIAGIRDHDAQVEAFDTAMEQLSSRGRGARKLQHHFERARHYRRLLVEEPGLTQREIGAREGISAARVGQRLQLLALAPEIIAAVDVPHQQLPVGVTEATLRPIARLRDHAEQVEPAVFTGKLAWSSEEG